MRRLPLSTLLVALNVGLLLLAVTGVAIAAVGLLRRLADDQALARVAQAGASAQNVVDRSGDDVQAAARLLAERPTLLRLVEADDAAALTSFLGQFQRTARLDASAIIRDDRPFAQSGERLDWESVWLRHRHAPTDFLERQSVQSGGEAILLGAWASVPASPGSAVMVGVLLDESFSKAVGEEVGLPVTVYSRDTALASEVSPSLYAQREEVLRSGQPVAARVDALGLYLATQPIRDPSGETVGLIEAALPVTAVDQSLRQLIQTLLLLTLGMASLAALSSLAIGRRLGRPLGRLTKAAARIGQGDLATPVPSAASAEIGTLAATLDEMRRRLLRLTADLRRQQAESSAILTGIIEGVFTVDRERRVRYMNPQAAELLATTAEAAMGRFCGDLLYAGTPVGERPCEDRCPILHARFRGGARATEHLRLPGGRQRTVLVASAPPMEESSPGGGLRQVQVIRDETELEATRRLRDAVLANISHEFRTPLSAQLASIELLLDQLPELSEDQIGELVLSLQRGTLRLTQLIDNLLESVRIESGQQTLRRRPLALDEVVEAALELTQPLMDQRHQTVSLELPYPLPLLSGDAPRLTQVFVNLLANAGKFAPEGTTIRIGGTVETTQVRLWVQDEGPGLPVASGESLFAPFVRSAVDEPEQSGMGLGLWIVKSIVERHGGRVEAESTSAGTRMCVTLPLGVDEGPTTKDEDSRR